MRGLEPRLIKHQLFKADALLIFSVFIIIIIYFTVKYLLNLGSSPLIRFVIYK